MPTDNPIPEEALAAARAVCRYLFGFDGRKFFAPQIARIIARETRGAAEEREACAALAESGLDKMTWQESIRAQHIAAAIRARGQDDAADVIEELGRRLGTAELLRQQDANSHMKEQVSFAEGLKKARRDSERLDKILESWTRNELAAGFAHHVGSEIARSCAPGDLKTAREVFDDYDAARTQDEEKAG